MTKDIQSELMDNTHILVVDDNHINRLFFQSALKKLSCQVTTANNGIEAVNKSADITFDLILMDIRMDGMNGIEAAKSIKQLSNNRNTPIIAVSAESFDADQDSLFETSLLKPVKQTELSEIINRFATAASVFNHQKALEVSHQDEEIVMHLRSMFIDQLSEQKTELISLYENKNFDSLQEKLHQLLGSAKICAADAISKDIETLKSEIQNETANHQMAFQNLIKSINETIKQA
jgi:two-component system sensor histidine kinase BarA